ncbi:copper amine oxidase N-terminal domain-containing protein [Peptoniphilus mikwangii]|uniref:copper amine oxidase N-terminal domain-containing protein n=1 Tax=Peptoniphilus mikwangii TaxID=1354300 RepID=UPI000425B101|nr:copper amine oxidase N-terminal domain-containing protein [Peptoniphilus mikwangii]
MKKFINLLFVILILIIGTNVYAAKPIKIELDGKEIKTDVMPYIKNSRTLVPLRFISEALNYKVDWNAEKREVTVSNNMTTIVLTIDKTEVLVNGTAKENDVAPEITKDRTFVPIRFIAENLGVTVDWDKDNYIVKLSSTDKYKNLSADEKEYISKITSLSTKLQTNFNELKKYYFEDAGKYTPQEIAVKYNSLKSEIENLAAEINSLNAPKKFTNSDRFLKEAAILTKDMVNEFTSALSDGNSDSAKKVISIQTKLAIKLAEIKKALEAELEGKIYEPDKDIKSFNETSNLLEDQTIKNLLNKI